jgi:ABC-2 type transport system permease protein
VFFIVQVLATSMLSEKQDGTFCRLMVAPLPRTAMLLGKLLPFYIVNLIQVASMFAIGHFVFNMSLGHAPLAMVMITLATAAAATGLGLLVATLGKTPEQIGGFSTMLALTLAALGGMMVPVFSMPEFMQKISKISPHNWALSGYQDVIVRGLGLADVWLEAGVLGGFALVFFLFAVWRFRFQDE